jgi:hypothetical protein
VSPKHVVWTAGIALAVVIAHQKVAAGAVPGIRVSQ